MINKDLFIKTLKNAEKFIAEADRWCDFGIEIYDLPINEIPWELFKLWGESHFTSEGLDWIDWYLWERKSVVTGELLACYDENGDEFYVKNLDDLWDIVKNHIKKPCVDSKCTYYKNQQCTNL